MIIRIIALILWLFLGVFYYSLYTNTRESCCTHRDSAILQNQVLPVHQNSTLEQNSIVELPPGEIDSLSCLDTLDSFLKEHSKNENAHKKHEDAINKEPEKAVIFFPQNSKTRLTSETLEKYLDDVAKRVKKSQEIISLHGHTDKLGTEKKNMELGLARAKMVKKLLLKRGVPSSQIMIKSMGSKKPIGNNKTRKGRSKNRRVELFIK